MSKANVFENDFLLLVFNNTNASDIGDATGLRGSSAAGSLFVSLHTADPGEAGNQTTSETSYTGYARVAVARSGAGWSVSADTVSNAALIQFPQCTGGTANITHFAVGTSVSGTGKILYKGALTSALSVSSGIQPQFAAGDLDISEQ